MYGAGSQWRNGPSMLCRIARQSSQRWRSIEYGCRRDGTRRLAIRGPDGLREYSNATSERQRSGIDGISGSITTTSPAETSIDRILDQLPSNLIPSQAKSTDNGHPSILLLLSTPAYSHHVMNSKLSLDVFKRLSGSETWHKDLRTVTAVVNQIPGSSGDVTDGVDGLAYGFVKDGPEFDPSRSSLKELSQMTQKPGWLDFELATEGTASTTVQVPLARTIFSNGKVSTLIHALYRPNEHGQLQLHSETDLENFRVEAASEAANTNFHLHAPLVPLTPARQIRNIMGNIIRTVSAEPSFSGSGKVSDRTQPASEELESAVTAYFTAANISPQPVAVWALIIPSPLPSAHSAESESTYRLLGSQTGDLEALWTSSPSSASTQDLVNSVLNHLLPAGARLRKVLSGGGGWGKKAGLLSLDPDDRYSTRELRQDAGWEIDINEDPREQQRQALGEAAKAGESVMFFLAPAGLEGGESGAQAERSVETSMVFGSLPSSIDAMPTSAWDSTSPGPTVEYHAGLLGALSEEGLALTMTDRNGKFTRTKFDVPYSRIDISRAERAGSRPTQGLAGKRQYSTSARPEKQNGETNEGQKSK